MIVVQVVGYKNAGKTTLLERLIDCIASAGYCVGTVKHDAHQFEIDMPGTDTWRHRQAGSMTTVIASDTRAAFIEERTMKLADILSRLHHLDVVLVEGFKHEAYPKIVLVRDHADEILIEQLEQVIAIVSWMPNVQTGYPIFSIDEPNTVADWLLEQHISSKSDHVGSDMG